MTDKEHPEDSVPEDGGPDQEPEPERPRGQIRFQDPETTKPRAATLGEQRARRKALEEEREREIAEAEAAERKRKLRKRILIGGGVTVGVVALVAVWYSATSSDEVTANCVGDDSVLSSDENYCDQNYVTSHGGHYSNGIFFIPLGNGAFQQYRYNYGGTVGSGGRVSGGTLTAPGVDTTVKTNSGKTVQRGGFGVSGGSKSGSGSSGGSKSGGS